MSDIVTLKYVESLAVQLPQEEQRKLVEHLQEHMRTSQPGAAPNPEDEERARQKRIAETEAYMAELDAFVESLDYKGESDSARLIREIREERMDRL